MCLEFASKKCLFERKALFPHAELDKSGTSFPAKATVVSDPQILPATFLKQTAGVKPQRMELTGGADCGALEGDEKSERVEEEAASGGSVRVERLVRPARERMQSCQLGIFECSRLQD